MWCQGETSWFPNFCITWPSRGNYCVAGFIIDIVIRQLLLPLLLLFLLYSCYCGDMALDCKVEMLSCDPLTRGYSPGAQYQIHMLTNDHSACVQYQICSTNATQYQLYNTPYTMQQYPMNKQWITVLRGGVSPVEYRFMQGFGVKC